MAEQWAAYLLYINMPDSLGSTLTVHKRCGHVVQLNMLLGTRTFKVITMLELREVWQSIYSCVTLSSRKVVFRRTCFVKTLNI